LELGDVIRSGEAWGDGAEAWVVLESVLLEQEIVMYQNFRDIWNGKALNVPEPPSHSDMGNKLENMHAFDKLRAN
jgi:hypothetical protein